jgi:hypothetical protein
MSARKRAIGETADWSNRVSRSDDQFSRGRGGAVDTNQRSQRGGGCLRTLYHARPDPPALEIADTEFAPPFASCLAGRSLATRANGGRHERAFHNLRHLGSTPEPSADIWLDRDSAALAKIGRLAVRSISPRTPLHARARTQMARKTWRGAHASILALLPQSDQCRPSRARSDVTCTPTSGDHP